MMAVVWRCEPRSHGRNKAGTPLPGRRPGMSERRSSCFLHFFVWLFLYLTKDSRVFCILSPWKVWFAFKNLVGALDFFSSFSPAPRRCGAHYRKPKAAPLLCTKMLLTTATTTHFAARRQPPRRLACFAPRRRG